MKDTSILGLSRKMKNGMMATVIADRNAKDIDVQFEDGTIVEHKQRNSFLLGLISNPSLGKMHSRIKSSSIVGKQNTMKNGMMATVIDDRGKDDIDIQFDDGTVVEHTRRDRFKTGNIANPTLGRMFYKTITHSIVGEERIMNNGMRATVIADRGQNNIDVKFEDGTIWYISHKMKRADGLLHLPFLRDYSLASISSIFRIISLKHVSPGILDAKYIANASSSRTPHFIQQSVNCSWNESS